MHSEVFPREQVCLSNWFRYPVPTKIRVVTLIKKRFSYLETAMTNETAVIRERPEPTDTNIGFLLSWLDFTAEPRILPFCVTRGSWCPTALNPLKLSFNLLAASPFPPSSPRSSMRCRFLATPRVGNPVATPTWQAVPQHLKVKDLKYYQYVLISLNKQKLLHRSGGI